MSGIIQCLLYTLIILIILLLPVEIRYRKYFGATLEFDFTLFCFAHKIGNKKLKTAKKTAKKSSSSPFKKARYYMPFLKAFNYLLPHTSVTVNRLKIKETDGSADSIIKGAPAFLGISILLSLIKSRARKFTYSDSTYLFYEKENEPLPGIIVDFSLRFILFHLIISLFIALYYKVKKSIKG